jgi:hypothetical protein
MKFSVSGGNVDLVLFSRVQFVEPLYNRERCDVQDMATTRHFGLQHI